MYQSSTFDVLDQDTGYELLTIVLCLVTAGFKSRQFEIIVI